MRGRGTGCNFVTFKSSCKILVGTTVAFNKLEANVQKEFAVTRIRTGVITELRREVPQREVLTTRLSRLILVQHLLQI